MIMRVTSSLSYCAALSFILVPVLAIDKNETFPWTVTANNSTDERYRMFETNNNDIIPSDAITNQILCGYQGWYNFPGDGAPINMWKHWFKRKRDNKDNPTHDEVQIDMMPYIDEYDDGDLKETTGIIHRDGSNAKFFSSARPKVVLKHFEWMRTYGISGIFHHRFITGLDSRSIWESKTMVLRNVKAAAEKTGRVFAVSYDIAGSNLDYKALDTLKEDWMRLVDDEKITESNRYLHHNGKPVLSIWGIGFTHVPASSYPNKMIQLINWLQNEAPSKYRVFLIAGVPRGWRDRNEDSYTGKVWKLIYESVDAIHPWFVGRWKTIQDFENYMPVIAKDAKYCKNRGILYMPTMYPGFSWHNLRKPIERPINSIPRQGGQFIWKQAYGMISDPNIKTIWLAQFDELDEATAIFKVKAKQSELPTKGNWIGLDVDGHDLPPDWYLRLTGEAQRMLNGERPLTRTIPIDPSDPPPPPPQSQTEVSTSTHLTLCGRGSGCGKDIFNFGIEADSNELHESRCCRDCSGRSCNEGNGWKSKCSLQVQGRSKIDGECSGQVDYLSAKAFCESIQGGRLCTAEEVQSSCVKGTGCNYDTKMIWVG